MNARFRASGKSYYANTTPAQRRADERDAAMRQIALNQEQMVSNPARMAEQQKQQIENQETMVRQQKQYYDQQESNQRLQSEYNNWGYPNEGHNSWGW